jgi:predicted SprT family Zn-dependent metalloprotease
MFVYGNGKWHQVRNVEEAARIKVYKTRCGCTYHDDNKTSEDESIRESRYFCSRCGAKKSLSDEEPTRRRT